jgi:hypothetical protein
MGLLSILLIGAMSRVAWIGYQLVGTYELNSHFCASFQDLHQQRSQILSPFQHLLKENLTKSLFENEIQMPMDRFLKTHLQTWEMFRKQFDAKYLATFEKNYSQVQVEPWLTDFSCDQGLHPFAWLNLPAFWQAELPASARFEPKDVTEWQDRLKELESRLPAIRKQMERDQKILCSTAESIRRNLKIETYYLERCSNCQTKSDFVKIRGLLERNKSLLQQNWALFRMKWSQIQPPCLRGFTDDRGQILDSAFAGHSGRVGASQ